MSETLTSNASRTILLAPFFVRDALCALDAARIQEVVRLGPLTHVRHAPPEVAGIVNRRGKIVNILDIGLLVDRVDEVVEAERGQLQPPPANVSMGQAHYFQGVYRTRGRGMQIVDPETSKKQGNLQ